MNPFKKENGWIMCSSKSYPGKTYYFNLNNGETTWSLNEGEKKTDENPPIQKTDNTHCYPEPNSPPVGQPLNLSEQITIPNIHFRDMSLINKTTSNNVSTILIQPMNYGTDYSNKDMPSFQIQVPIIGTDFPNNAHQVVVIVMNQSAIRQIPAIQRSRTEPDRDLFIQNGRTPLGQRFVNFKPVSRFQTNNAENDTAKKLFTSTPNKTVAPVFQHNETTIVNSRPQNDIANDTPIKKSVHHTIINLTPNQTPENPSLYSSMFIPTNSPTNFTPKNCSVNNTNGFKANQFQPFTANEDASNQVMFQKANPFQPNNENSTLRDSLKADMPINLVKPPNLVSSPWAAKDLSLGSGMEKSPLIQGNKVNEATPNKGELNVKDLGTNDLRRILMAKKKKAVDLGKPNTDIEGNKIMTVNQEELSAPAKKKVTFNLTSDEFSDIMSDDNLAFSSPDAYLPNEEKTENSAINQLRNLAPKTTNFEKWYLVVDTTVLLEDFEFFSDFVQQDRNCKLLILARVMSDTVTLARGECPDRGRVTLARHTLRMLATPHPHITIQPTHCNENTDLSTDYAILNNCLDIIQQQKHVVLITNNADLQFKATCLKIHCFNSLPIKEAPNKPQVHFDIKKIKISVPNVTEKGFFDNETNGIGSTSNYVSRDEMLNSNCQLTPFKVASKPERLDSMHSENMPKKITEQFQIQKDVTQVKRIQTTLPKESFKSVPNSNKAEPFYFQNRNPKNGSVPEMKKKVDSEKENQTVSFSFQNNVKDKEDQYASIFKTPNEKLLSKEGARSIFEDNDQFQTQPKSSNFELDGIEKINSNHQAKTPIFDDNCKPKPQKTVLNYETYKNRALQAKKLAFDNSQLATKPSLTVGVENKNKGAQLGPTIFEIEKYKNKEAEKPSTFEKESGKTVLPEAIKDESIEIYVQKFYNKHKIADNVIGERKGELLCNFKQVMEECLSNILQQWSCKLKSTPPWMLYEALQCVLQVHGDHTRVRTSVAALRSLMHDDRDVGAGDVVKVMCWGLMLVGHLKTIYKGPNAQVLTDAEDAINTMVRNLHLDVDVEPDKQPFCHGDIDAENHHHRLHFVKQRSEVINYLKKHYSAWTDFDETLEEEKANLRNSSKDVSILRTLGKNLNLLKISNSNTMTMNKPELDNVTGKKNTPEQKDKETHNNEIEQDDNNNKTVMKTNGVVNYNNYKTKIENEENSFKNLSKKFTMNVTRKVDNPKAQDNLNSQKTSEGKAEVKQTIPTFKRLLNNINQVNKTADSEKPILDLNYATHGHSFGNSNTGQKVVRNIQVIKAFEEKLKRAPLDLDELDYTAVTEEENNDATDDCLNNDDRENDTKEPPNDHLKVTNKLLNFDSCNNTNNDSYSMSFDNCVSINDVNATNDVGSYENDAVNDVGNYKDDAAYDVGNYKNDATNDVGNYKNDARNDVGNYKNDARNDVGNNKNDAANDVGNYKNDARNDVGNYKNDARNDVGNYKNDARNDVGNNKNDAANDVGNYKNDARNDVGNNKNDAANDIGNYKNYAENAVGNNKNDGVNDVGNYENDAVNDYSSLTDNFTSDLVSYLTNIASYGSNDDNRSNKQYFGSHCVDFKTNDNFDAANDEDKEKDSANDDYTKVASKDDVINDSGFENDSDQVCSLVKTFLYELNSSFKLVHNFIDASIKEFREDTLIDVRRKMLRCTANAALEQIINIIDKLQSIIRRESSNGPKMQVLLGGAGSFPSNDTQITHYKQEVTKHLEHAQMLDEVLRVVLSITSDNKQHI